MDSDFGIVWPAWASCAVGEFDPGMLARAAGEAAIDRVVVPVVTGPVEHFRLADGAPRYSHTEGGWHFRPRADLYGSTRLKPRSARWHERGGRDIVERLCAEAARREQRVVFRVDVRSALASDNHSTRSRTAWGDGLVGPACMANPDVRELLRATLEDLTRFEPAGFEIVDCVPQARSPAIDSAFGWRPAAKPLVETCFCESCRQVALEAGIDADSVARSIQVESERLLKAEELDSSAAAVPAAAASALERDPLIGRYRGALERHFASWLSRLAERHENRIRMHLLPDEHTRETGWTRLVWLSSCRPGSDALEDRLAALTQPGADCQALCLPGRRPDLPDSAALVRIVDQAVQHGVRYIDFEGLSEAPPAALTWVKQAVRFARRR